MNDSTEKKLEVLAKKPDQPLAANVKMGFDSAQGFELMQRAASLLCASTLVPTKYQGTKNLPNCVVALNMANRIGADPLMVMQNLYIVHGNPSWSAQFVIACFNQCGRFSAMRFRWINKPSDPDSIPDNWACQAYATEFATGEEITGPTITIKMAKKEGWYGKSGSKWQTIPELMLMYRAGAWLQRTHAPDISMGLKTAEEEGDIIESRRNEQGTFVADAQATGEARVASKLDELASGDAKPPADGKMVGDPPDLNGLVSTVDQNADRILAEADKQPTMTELIKAIEAADSVDIVAEQIDLARNIKRLDYRGRVHDAGRKRMAELLPTPVVDTKTRHDPAAANEDGGGLFGDG